MIQKIIHKLSAINPWHFTWIITLASVVFGLILNTIQSYLWWGFLSRDLLLIGIIDGFFIPLFLAPIVIYVLLHTAKLEELNTALELEIIRVKENEREKGRETEALYRILFENAPVGIGIADRNGTLITFNDAMLVPGGYTREDMATIRNVSHLYYTIEERDRALAVFMQQGFLHQYPVRFKRRDGTPYDALLSLRPVTYQGTVCSQAMVEDITERKEMEDALRNNERRYKTLFEDSPIALCEMDISAVKQYLAALNGAASGDMRTYFEHHPEVVHRCAALLTIVDMNNAMLELFGAKTKEELRQNLAHTFHEESYDLFREDILSFMANRKSFEHESVGQTLAGQKIHIFLKWFSAAGYDEAGSRVIASFIDITGLKRAEESLIESREWFRKLVETMNEGLGIQDEKGVITYVNERFCQMVEYSADEMIGKQLSDFLDETYRKVLEERIAIRKKGDRTPYDLRWMKKNGDFVYTLVSPQPLFDETGAYKGSFATITNITERKQLEKSLQESEDRFRITLHNSPIVVFNQDRNLRFTWIYNPRHGHTQEDVIGKTDADVCEVENPARLIEIKQCVIKNGVSQREEVGIKYAGEILYYDSYFEPLYDPDGSIIGLTGVAIDITKRKRQEELIRSYQEQLSLMASKLSLVEEKERRRIAKDLHDNIGQILACAKIKLGELNKSCNADCNATLRQIGDLVEQSILYTRSLTSELSVPILYEMGLEPAVAWLGREFQKNHSVQFHISDDSASKPLNDDIRIVLFKAVRELLTNVAKHAHAKNVTVSLARNDGAMQVTVEDDGIGFDVADVQKSPRIQSCFGLFSIREALKNSGGSVEIVSARGGATRIILTAPLEA